MSEHHTPSTMMAEQAAAAYLGYRPSALRAWRHFGRGPAYIRHGRSVRYHVRDLDAWLDAHRVRTRDARTPVHDDAHQSVGA